MRHGERYLSHTLKGAFTSKGGTCLSFTPKGYSSIYSISLGADRFGKFALERFISGQKNEIGYFLYSKYPGGRDDGVNTPQTVSHCQPCPKSAPQHRSSAGVLVSMHHSPAATLPVTVIQTCSQLLNVLSWQLYIHSHFRCSSSHLLSSSLPLTSLSPPSSALRLVS